jgi:hypothetical protein
MQDESKVLNFIFAHFLSSPKQTRNGGTVTTVNTIWFEGGEGVSKLTLSKLGNDDEGNYSCRSNGNFESDVVTLRVVSEDVEEGKRFAKSNLFCVITWF